VNAWNAERMTYPELFEGVTDQPGTGLVRHARSESKQGEFARLWPVSATLKLIYLNSGVRLRHRLIKTETSR
jgi:hypothetical protein